MQRNFFWGNKDVWSRVWQIYSNIEIQGVFLTGTPPKSTKKLIWARLDVSGPIYVNVDSPNLGFTYFNFLGGYQLKNTL